MSTRWSAAALAAVSATIFTGCVNHAHYPPVPGSLGYTNPNTPAVEEVMMAGLRWTAARYPAVAEESAPLALNLPEGVRGRVYERIAETVPGAQPLTPENSHLPIYHVGAIRIRGDRAQVSIFRPILSVGPMRTGETVYQEVRVDLQGGLSSWHVVSWREWTPGSGETPPLNYYTPEPPAPRDGPRIGGVYQ
jgi:hypothetical protein